MQMFDIEFDHELFLNYTQELHKHLFGDGVTFEDLIRDIDNHHQKHHLVTLHLLKDKETFHSYYDRKHELGLDSVLNIIICALTEDTAGDKIKEHLVSCLSITPEMKTSEAKSNDRKLLMKNLKSFMMYARKKRGVFDQAIQE
ncbi:hypothetical protein ACFFK0_06475 [Paenibacillus chartarius]|uniref:Uncharacterized protein n=1 Tax=Paenibacillus chartarius TaxID=747481 RepID=A0ABV6DHM6_9BACL